MASPLRLRKRAATLGRRVARGIFRSVFTGDGSDVDTQGSGAPPVAETHTMRSSTAEAVVVDQGGVGQSPASPETATPEPETSKQPALKLAVEKKAPVKKTAAKKAAPVKKTAAKKAAPVKKTAAKKAAPKKAAAKKAAPVKKTAAKKAAPKKAAAKKASSPEAPPAEAAGASQSSSKAAPQKAPAKEAAPIKAASSGAPANQQSGSTSREPEPAAAQETPTAEDVAEQRRLAHWEKTRTGVLGFVHEQGGRASLRDVHDYSERRYFIAHQSFSRLMEELTDGELLEFDFDSGMATLTTTGRELVG